MATYNPTLQSITSRDVYSARVRTCLRYDYGVERGGRTSLSPTGCCSVRHGPAGKQDFNDRGGTQDCHEILRLWYVYQYLGKIGDTCRVSAFTFEKLSGRSDLVDNVSVDSC